MFLSCQYLIIEPAKLVKSLYIIAICLLCCGSVSAQQGISDLLGQLGRATGDSQKIAAYKKIIVYYSTTNPDSENYYGKMAIQYTIDRKYRLGEALITAQLAVIDENQGQVNIGEKRARYALGIFRELNYLQGVGEMLHNLGSLEAGKGNFDVAMKLFYSALKVYDTVTDYHGLMMVYMNMGNLYMAHGDKENAWKYLLKAKETSKLTPLCDASIFLYNNLGVMKDMQGDKDTALKIFINNLALSDKPEFVNSHTECLDYLGEYYRENNNPILAATYLEKGLKTARENRLPEMEANMLMEIARLKEKDFPDSAIQYLRSAAKICEQISSKTFLAMAYSQIAEIYKQQGDYKSALEATEKKLKLTDSIYNIEKTREITAIGSEFEFEKSRERISELEALSMENAIERNTSLIFAAVIIFALAIVGFFYQKTINLNRKLKVREKELEENNSMKDKLFSIIGHDLRSPLAKIPDILHIYDDPETTAEEKEFMFSHLKEHTKASLETLDKLLYWGNSLMKGIHLNQANIDPKPFIKANTELKKIKAEEKQITITDHTPGDLKIFADPSHFDFVIRNLLANALKYTFAGGNIDINADSKTQPGFVVFSVADNGTGIAEENLGKIFSPIVSTEGTAMEKGTGIGLMLCKEFVVNNGGKIWVESMEGKGAVFYFSLKRGV